MDVDIEKIKQLADLAQEKDLAEIEVVDGDKSVTIRTVSSVLAEQPANVVYSAPTVAAPAAPQPVIPAAANVTAAITEPATPTASANGFTVTSPMVGTFYSAPSPESPDFVEVGKQVSEGQTLCIIEAMKLMNELESEVSGKVLEVLIKNGEPVEFGQPIMIIEKA